MVGTSESFDVYVSDGVLLEVHRGPHMAVAQTHGVDWTCPPLVNVHPETFVALTKFEAKTPLATAGPVISASTRYERYGWVVPAVFVALVIVTIWLVCR